MHSLSLSRGAPADRHPLLTWSLAFWAATYALFTLRSQLTPDEVTIMLSGQRFVSTLAGAALFAAVLAAARDGAGMSRTGLRLLWTVIPASLIVLAVRALANDWWGAAIPFITDVRWMLTWASYFSFGLGLFLLAHRDGGTGTLVRRATAAVQSRRPAGATSAVDIPVGDTPAAASDPHVVTAATDSYAWVIDALAHDLATAPAATRRTVLTSLERRVGYAIADPADPVAFQHNWKVDLVARLAARSATKN